MSRLREAVSHIWDAMNPLDPSPAYLVKFMVFALAVFAIAILLGGLIG